MTVLSTLLASRVPQVAIDALSAEVTETNLSPGQIWVYHSGNSLSPFPNGVCWIAPSNGTAIVEIWGAAGSGAGGCCCFGGIPGNAPAYSKRTVTVQTGDNICGSVGQSCGNASTISFRGCSESTCIRICTSAGGCVCMCAEGGAGGCNICNPSSSMYCCFAGNGYCATNIGAGCGVICNQAGRVAQAYGGTTNCSGCMSCMTFNVCNTENSPNIAHIAYPAGIFSKSGGWISFETGGCFSDNNWSSLMPYYQALQGMNGKSMGYNIGATLACWGSGGQCGCYEFTGCFPFVPYGMPGMSGPVRSGQQGRGQRGGHGALKITFVGS
jgi:hypothetical protein